MVVGPLQPLPGPAGRLFQLREPCLRLQHVEAYLEAHPGAPLQEAILESGFNSRQAYYAVKARLSA